MALPGSDRTDAEEDHRLLDGVLLGDIGVFNDQLTEWSEHHKHQHSAANAPPRWCRGHSSTTSPFASRTPARLLTSMTLRPERYAAM